MKKIKGEYLQPDGWDSFFDRIKEKKGNTWRNKDYGYLNEIFDVKNFEGDLIDIGCAFGDGLLYLKKRCKNITNFYGSDISPEAIKTCNENNQLNFCEFFNYDISKPLPRKYDNIICLQTIEHVEDPTLVMNNLINATNKLLIIGTPHKNNRPDRNHIWSFDEMDFVDLVDKFILGQFREDKYLNIYYIVQKK